jgi:hypothetical protein
MKDKISIRIGNIEFCSLDACSGKFFACLTNSYSGKLEEYLSNGWVDNGDEYIRNDQSYGSINKRLFKEDQTKLVIAFLHYNQSNKCFELTTAGDNLLKIDNMHNFITVYKTANDLLNKSLKNNDIQAIK